MSSARDTCVYASHPFDDTRADVILLSSDGIYFKCFKLLLSFASSSFFEGMFSLPQPTDAISSQSNSHDGLAIIPVSEPSSVLDLLLRFCYPITVIDQPTVGTLDDVVAVLEASRKYGMDRVEKCVLEILVEPRFVKQEPMRVYGIACRFRLDDEARIAARYTLRRKLMGFPYVKEMQHMSGGDHHRLLQYHLECGGAARTTALQVSWIPRNSFVWFQCTDQDLAHDDYGGYFIDISGNSMTTSATSRKWWWDNYMTPCATALIDRPCGETVLASALIEKALASARPCQRCEQFGPSDLNDFARIFAEEIEKATAKVSLKLTYSNLDSISLIRSLYGLNGKPCILNVSSKHLDSNLIF